MFSFEMIYAMQSLNFSESEFRTRELSLFSSFSPDAQLQLLHLDSRCIRTTWCVSPGPLVKLRQARRKERGKEVILSKSQRPEPRARCFGANFASHDRPLLSKCLQRMVGQGGFGACTYGGEGALGEEWEWNLNFCKVTSHRLRFWQRGTLMAATWSES